MNTLFSCCIADPFLDVAKRLKEECGLTAVYWIGDLSTQNDQETDKGLVESTFPNIVYHKFLDAWKGIFPAAVEQRAAETYVDIDFLHAYASQEFQALSMMDRVDFDRQSFNFMERERYFLYLVKRWTACVELYDIGLVVSAVNPHRIFDYVLYWVCKHKGIPFLTFEHTMVSGRLFPMLNFSEPEELDKIFDECYQECLSKKCSVEDLPVDIRENYQKLHQDYATARPRYMARHDVNDKKHRSTWFRLTNFIKVNKLWGKHSVFIEGKRHYIFKRANQTLAESNFPLWEWYKKRKAALRYKDYLHGYYCSLATRVPLDVPYIIFFLHYQPEETTSPRGDIFTNQLLCVETLLKNSPSNMMVYVKEHPNQFMAHMSGHMKRIKEFYDDLVQNPRVRLVPFEIDSFTLIEHAAAVATVTGTVGWESAVRKKPVIIFGLVWYERMKGVLKVTDDASAQQIASFINNYQFDEETIVAYLSVIARYSIRAYHYKGYKEATGIPHDEAVNNLCQSIKFCLLNHV